ncbi:MAG: hypothetical protein DMF12_01330 [Verrucomicrobia bacterium]|nr:MAG: hypothetical protein DMF12_01330 [Verrucomicrobiota bacterium]
MAVYDPTGNLTKLIDPNGNTTRWQYDSRNRVERELLSYVNR